MKWEKYVPKETYAAYKVLLPQLQGRYGKGLTEQERQYYSGNMKSGIADQLATSQQGLEDNLARSGVQPGSGAGVEAYGNLARGGVMGLSNALTSLTGMDISQRQQNLANLMAALGLPQGPAVGHEGQSSAWNFNTSASM
jgi:hypothetical protein